MRRRLLGLALLWTAAQAAWLAADGRIVDGDELGILGQAEIFWDGAARDGWLRTAWAAWTQTFGEYPSVAPALQGMAGRATGVAQLGGDGLARRGLLLWGWPLLLATAVLGRALGRARAGLWAAGLLAASPLVSGLLRHVLLEPAMAAAVAGAAAAAAVAVRHESTRAWLACGLLGGAALAIKQTAALALLPLAVAGLAVGGRRAAVALAPALVVAGAFYGPRLAEDSRYLFAAAGTNPDALPAWRQALMYPAVLLQQAASPIVWLGALAVAAQGPTGRASSAAGTASRTAAASAGSGAHDEPTSASPDDPAARVRRLVLLWLALGAVVLVLLPKKYPRLLLPLLPGLAALGGAWLATTGRRAQAGLAALSLAGFLGSSFAPAPLGRAFAPRLGLGAVDERCPQRWVESPAPGVPWAELAAALEGAGGPGTEYRVGSLDWPVPPCSHQTTQDLGEHLRVRMRWAGSEAWVMAGEDWGAAPGWPSGAPDLLITDGPWSCAQLPAACAGRRLQPVLALPPLADDWPVALHVWRLE